MRTALRMRPDRDTFEHLARSWPMVAVWTELLADSWTPVAAFEAVAGGGAGSLLESVERSERWGRYSFVAGEPAALIVADDRGLHVENLARDLPLPERTKTADVLTALKDLYGALGAPRLPDLPTLSGGLVGFLAYDAARLLGGHPHPTGGDVACPPIALQVVDRAVVFDHWRQRVVVVAHVACRGRRPYDEGCEAVEEMVARLASAGWPEPEPLTDGVAASPTVTSPAPERFRDMVVAAKERIREGDVFQAVLSRRFSFPARAGGLPIYRRLRVTNPSPYMFFLRAGGIELAGSSPEPLVRVEGRRVITRPIAGTRRRGKMEDDDAALERELQRDAKERAEHAMLVDLARNDLGQVCRPGSVRPTEVMAVERYSRVMHLVSTVEGELQTGAVALDALAATFPAGTVTGAPKRRAMEIIAAEEARSRGPYAGAAGYVSFAGDLDFCITIRTAVVEAGIGHVQAGAGIVADSDPDRELSEIESKAAALLAAARAGRP